MGVGKFFCRAAEIVKIGFVLVAFVKIIKLIFKLGELLIGILLLICVPPLLISGY